MSTTITLALRAEDAKPILRQAAYDAAKYSAQLDYCMKNIGNHPRWSGSTFADWRKEITDRFLKAKRMVEAFGVEYEQTSEQETLTVDWRWVGGKSKLVRIAGIAFNEVTGSQPDYDNPFPSYRGEVHSQACHAAAGRVVRTWLGTMQEAKAA